MYVSWFSTLFSQVVHKNQLRNGKSAVRNGKRNGLHSFELGWVNEQTMCVQCWPTNMWYSERLVFEVLNSPRLSRPRVEKTWKKSENSYFSTWGLFLRRVPVNAILISCLLFISIFFRRRNRWYHIFNAWRWWFEIIRLKDGSPVKVEEYH